MTLDQFQNWLDDTMPLDDQLQVTDEEARERFNRLVKMEMSDYNRAPGIRSSTLKHRTPKAMRHSFFTEDGPNYALSLGSLVHMAVLEPDRYDTVDGLEECFVYAPGKTLSSDAAYKAWLADPGKIMITADMKEKADLMRDEIFAHPFADSLFRVRGKRELSGFAWSSNSRCILKARFDFLPDDADYIPDIKTTTSIEERSFWFDCVKFGYHSSAAQYMDIAHQLEGKPRRKFFIVAVEGPKGPTQGPRDEPYDCAVYELNCMEPSFVQKGREAYRNRLAKFVHSARTGSWVGAAEDHELGYQQFCAEPPFSRVS